ncbi:MAG TPA: vitamin K epoxide reductase family protein [Chitinophaga sp.]|uniref:vitamin K epoxide reductase family protein n=1 Tax=Chitinophaga sp. TaxID=1869181 RepID=UPI002B7511E2|nr:vitamin K epoxide reductase family protein [Chitinophaga sp.]HVI47978.1 vitamin K epoxide reductase family protein [Chitinophaga sp.]
MFAFFEKLLEPKSNTAEAAGLLAALLHVKITKTTLVKEIESHPDYPSLLSISDVLRSYGIDNLALNVEPAKLDKAPTPFVTTVKGKDSSVTFFAVVKEAGENGFTFYDPEQHTWSTVSKEVFLKKYSGTVLLAEVEDEAHAGEKDYQKSLRKEKSQDFIRQTTAFGIPVIALVMGIMTFAQNGASALLPLVFAVLGLAGAIISTLLLWYELDQYNPVLQQICSAGKKINCGAVLQSGASKISGISWSTIGFTYFAGQLLLVLFTGITSPQALFIVSWLSILASPYVLFSVYYQWRVVKQWCVLCLCVQALLLLQLAVVLTGGWYFVYPEHAVVATLLTTILALAVPFIAATLLMPALQKAKESKNNKSELQRLKHNPEIFEALLMRQKALTVPTGGLGITLGNPAARHKVIKVCNPYCGPCAKAHPAMEELLEHNPDVQLQIIFTATNNEHDIKTPPVQHLLAIARQGDEAVTKQALNDWYLPEKKDYETFAQKYPMNGELKQQGPELEAMRDWCNAVNIEFTPTFFVSVLSPAGDGMQFFQLPKLYSINDLKYFLAGDE